MMYEASQILERVKTLADQDGAEGLVEVVASDSFKPHYQTLVKYFDCSYECKLQALGEDQQRHFAIHGRGLKPCVKNSIRSVALHLLQMNLFEVPEWINTEEFQKNLREYYTLEVLSKDNLPVFTLEDVPSLEELHRVAVEEWRCVVNVQPTNHRYHMEPIKRDQKEFIAVLNETLELLAHESCRIPSWLAAVALEGELPKKAEHQFELVAMATHPLTRTSIFNLVVKYSETVRPVPEEFYRDVLMQCHDMDAKEVTPKHGGRVRTFEELRGDLALYLERHPAKKFSKRGVYEMFADSGELAPNRGLINQMLQWTCAPRPIGAIERTVNNMRY